MKSLQDTDSKILDLIKLEADRQEYGNRTNRFRKLHIQSSDGSYWLRFNKQV
jgi:hypothetical protein